MANRIIRLPASLFTNDKWGGILFLNILIKKLRNSHQIDEPINTPPIKTIAVIIELESELKPRPVNIATKLIIDMGFVIIRTKVERNIPS
ncbi:hypothetical protein ACQKP0_15165 [Heyndrickxia sp. NPDC080065]|uniref:hypothetical protein n=1 Tax=Heyndrickxia sp. NPDC080065 TaxID=3390568 RepID=UPI003D0622BE